VVVSDILFGRLLYVTVANVRCIYVRLLCTCLRVLFQLVQFTDSSCRSWQSFRQHVFINVWLKIYWKMKYFCTPFSLL